MSELWKDNWSQFQICMEANSIPTDHQYPENGNSERDREPDNGGDCGFHGQAVRLQKINCTGAFQVLVLDAM